MLINFPIITPHIDSRPVTINFYVDTADAITKFYKQKDHSLLFKSTDDSIVFNYDNLEEVGQFIAKPNEVYILNTNKIHSVVCQKMVNRSAYCLQSTKLTYDQTLELLNL